MTGFAHVQAQTGAGVISIEIKSVNSRFTDPTFRVPDELRPLEARLRERILQGHARGKLECRVLWRPHAAGPTPVTLDGEALHQLKELQEQIQLRFPDARPLSVPEILHWPGILIPQALQAPALAAPDEPQDTTAPAWSQIAPTVDAACGQFMDMRLREGERLAQVMREALAQARLQVARLRTALPELMERVAERLRTRLADLLPDLSQQIPAEELHARLRQEIGMLSLRADVTEELDRLDSHLTEFLDALDGTGPIGKRLDFLAQEMNREANTIASKAVALPVTDAAVALKLLIEQLREQVQNIE